MINVHFKISQNDKNYDYKIKISILFQIILFDIYKKKDRIGRNKKILQAFLHTASSNS